jgi:peptidoglycan/LPS O-acetylase OafA/YrhL
MKSYLGTGLLNDVGWWRVIFFGIPSLLVVYGVTSMEINGKLHFPKTIRKIGDASYSIYLSHLLVLSAIGRLSVQIANSGIVSHVLILVAMVLATIIVGLISYRWLEIPILNFIRTWRWRTQ